MERILYLFLVRHSEIPDVPPELVAQARKQWQWVESEVMKLPTPDRAYFDSLTTRDHERTMLGVREWVDAGWSLDNLAPTWRMLALLTAANVIIEPTEDAALHDQYFQFMDTLPRGLVSEHNHYRIIDLVDRRDRFIASQIQRTLRPGETGFLFQGVNHSIHRFLEADIKLGVYTGYVTPVGRAYEP